MDDEEDDKGFGNENNKGVRLDMMFHQSQRWITMESLDKFLEQYALHEGDPRVRSGLFKLREEVRRL